MLNFGNLSDDLFKRWYIDGRIYYHVVIDESNPKNGIQELRYIDPRKIRKVREISKDRDVKTGAQIIKAMAEYYVYNDRGTTTQTFTAFTLSGILGSLVTINSSTAATQATLSKSSGTVSVNYLSIRDSAATGGAGWYAGTTSTNVSNNTGWIFAAPSGYTAGGLFFAFF